MVVRGWGVEENEGRGDDMVVRSVLLCTRLSGCVCTISTPSSLVIGKFLFHFIITTLNVCQSHQCPEI